MKKIANIALNAIKDAGADKAQVVVIRAEKTELNMESGKLSLMRTTFGNSVSLVAIKDNKKGSSQLGTWDESAVKAAASEAVEMASAGQADEAYDVATLEDGETEFTAGLDKPEKSMLSSIVAIQKKVAEEYPQISCSYIIAFTKTEKLVVNTNDVEVKTTDGRYDVTAEFCAKEGETVSSFNYISGEFRKMPGDLMDFCDLRKFLEQSIRELGAKPVGDKFTGEVIFQPDCLYEMLNQYAGCFLEDAALIGETSVLKDKLGQKVASKIVNVRALAPNDNICGTYITNDGFRVKDLDIIINGVLESFLLTQYGAKKTGRKHNPFSPILEMDAGTKTLDEMIAGVKKGLLLSGHISGGSPSENGTFSGVAKNSFLIEDGKITRPVQETMISGNALDILDSITEVSKERRNNGISILPWVKAGNITIS